MVDAKNNRAGRGQAIAILEQKLDPQTLAIVRAALDDSDRLAVIRDAFLEGRDVQAVQMIRDLDPVGIRKVLGISSGVMRSHVDGQIAVRPQLPFRATHLVVSPRCAMYFDVQDIRIGNQSQYVNSSAIAADLFATGDVLHGAVDEFGFHTVKIGKRAEAWLPLRIDMPECQIGQEFIVTVTNVDGEPHEFRGALLGQVSSY